MKLNNYFEVKGFIFIENANINESCLNNSKLRLNKKGTNIFTQNIKGQTIQSIINGKNINHY